MWAPSVHLGSKRTSSARRPLCGTIEPSSPLVSWLLVLYSAPLLFEPNGICFVCTSRASSGQRTKQRGINNPVQWFTATHALRCGFIKVVPSSAGLRGPDLLSSAVLLSGAVSAGMPVRAGHGAKFARKPTNSLREGSFTT